jgi:ribulose-phosphate 3-epimerase
MDLFIAPSILSADFGRLTEEVQAAAAAGADWIHVDVMDGRFVPNLTIGPPVVAALRRATSLPLDVHLMVEAPERLLAQFAEAGADIITVHVEACRHLDRTLDEIRCLGARAGAALNPATGLETIRYVADRLDLLLCMSVNPGYGGQSFIPTALDKVRAARTLLEQLGRREVIIEVDGGVGPDNAGVLVAAGCRALVAGTAIYGAPDYRAAIETIRGAGTSGARSDDAPAAPER